MVVSPQYSSLENDTSNWTCRVMKAIQSVQTYLSYDTSHQWYLVLVEYTSIDQSNDLCHAIDMPFDCEKSQVYSVPIQQKNGVISPQYGINAHQSFDELNTNQLMASRFTLSVYTRHRDLSGIRPRHIVSYLVTRAYYRLHMSHRHCDCYICSMWYMYGANDWLFIDYWNSDVVSEQWYPPPGLAIGGDLAHTVRTSIHQLSDEDQE